MSTNTFRQSVEGATVVSVSVDPVYDFKNGTAPLNKPDYPRNQRESYDIQRVDTGVCRAKVDLIIRQQTCSLTGEGKSSAEAMAKLAAATAVFLFGGNPSPATIRNVHTSLQNAMADKQNVKGPMSHVYAAADDLRQQNQRPAAQPALRVAA